MTADVINVVNPNKVNGISDSYQLDKSISVLSVDGYFFIQILTANSVCKVEILVRCRNLQRLICVCTVYLCPHERTLDFYMG